MIGALTSLAPTGRVASLFVLPATLLSWLAIRYLHPLEPLNASETSVILLFWSLVYAAGRASLSYLRKLQEDIDDRNQRSQDQRDECRPIYDRRRVFSLHRVVPGSFENRSTPGEAMDPRIFNPIGTT